MGRREDLNRHHTIRHTFVPTPKRRMSTMLLLMFIIAAVMGVGTLTSRSNDMIDSSPSSNVQSASTQLPPPTRQQLFDTASIVAGGQWGPELLDDCLLLAKGFSAANDTDATDYARWLASGDQPNDDSERLIASISTDEAQAEVYRLALILSHQNYQSVNQDK